MDNNNSSLSFQYERGSKCSQRRSKLKTRDTDDKRVEDEKDQILIWKAVLCVRKING